jgi:hypothetical protein
MLMTSKKAVGAAVVGAAATAGALTNENFAVA